MRALSADVEDALLAALRCLTGAIRQACWRQESSRTWREEPWRHEAPRRCRWRRRRRRCGGEWHCEGNKNGSLGRWGKALRREPTWRQEPPREVRARSWRRCEKPWWRQHPLEAQWQGSWRRGGKGGKRKWRPRAGQASWPQSEVPQLPLDEAPGLQEEEAWEEKGFVARERCGLERLPRLHDRTRGRCLRLHNRFAALDGVSQDGDVREEAPQEVVPREADLQEEFSQKEDPQGGKESTEKKREKNDERRDSRWQQVGARWRRSDGKGAVHAGNIYHVLDKPCRMPAGAPQSNIVNDMLSERQDKPINERTARKKAEMNAKHACATLEASSTPDYKHSPAKQMLDGMIATRQEATEREESSIAGFEELRAKDVPVLHEQIGANKRSSELVVSIAQMKNDCNDVGPKVEVSREEDPLAKVPQEEDPQQADSQEAASQGEARKEEDSQEEAPEDPQVADSLDGHCDITSKRMDHEASTEAGSSSDDAAPGSISERCRVPSARARWIVKHVFGSVAPARVPHFFPLLRKYAREGREVHGVVFSRRDVEDAIALHVHESAAMVEWPMAGAVSVGGGGGGRATACLGARPGQLAGL